MISRVFQNRPLRRPVFFLLLAWLGAFSASALTNDYAEELVARARERALAQRPEWRLLLHYRPHWGGVESLIDDPRFFLAPDGKHNAQAELDATVRAFLATPGTNAGEHARCRFIARFNWLDRELHFDRARLPMAECETFEKIYTYLQPRAVALVYPAAYMNGPASMFGHTLLVFDSAQQNRLLSRAVSYAARTQPMLGPLFTFAGIFGLFPGYFAYQAYYEKVEQYGDIGHRDVWEYELDLTQEEVDQMLRHAWELQDIYSRYFFFDENCAYNLLYLIDVARPSLQLTRHIPWFVIPIDTVRQVQSAGLVRRVQYRPSPVTRLKYIAEGLPPDERQMALDVAGARRPVEDAAQNRAVLDLAAEYAQYLYTEERLAKEDYNARFLGLLQARARLGRAEEGAYAIPTPIDPARGHAPLKLSPGFGLDKSEGYVSLRYRLAYHALSDNDDGFTRGAQIQFLNTEARYLLESERGELQSFDVVDVFSVSPRNDLFQPASWKVRMGAEQADFDEGDDLLWAINTGAGLAYAPGGLDLVYLMVDGAVHQAEYYHADWAAGVGPSVGLMHTVGQSWKHLVQARSMWMGIADDLWRTDISWIQDYRCAADRSIGLDLRYADHDGHTVREANVRFHFYF